MQTQETLASQLASYKAGFVGRAPAARVAMMEAATAHLNGNGQWVLPVPATFVIARSGVIQFAHVEADCRVRAEPGDVLAVIRAMGQA